MSLFLLILLMFAIGAGVVFAGYAGLTSLPEALAHRRLERRLEDVSSPVEAEGADGESLLARAPTGPLPAFDRMVAGTNAGSWLSKLIDQSGCRTTPSAIVMMSIASGVVAALIAKAFSPFWYFAPVVGVAAVGAPVAFLLNRRSARMYKFEEQFPEALDLLSRALRAGHSFQSAMGMAAEELRAPVGPEFKRTFEQQNFGLPLRDALNQMIDRMPLLDVRFFVTAVLIQRETGGNLSEILDNLAGVVRERFTIRRQVRVHTAHGRFTAFVLLALPAALAVALSYINPEHMQLLFHVHMGQMMLIGAMVMQTIGFFWIRYVIKIEV